jgi:hypothetical protein
MVEVTDRKSELERRLQVELLWTRRLVFAESMNVDRYQAYAARRSLACPNDPPPLFQEANRFVDMSFEFPGRFD